MNIKQYSDDELSLMFMNEEGMYNYILQADDFMTEVLPFIAEAGIECTTGQLEQLKIDWDNGEFEA